MITAAVDILGGIGANYVQSGKCSNGPPAAFLKMHGVKDPFITYDRQVSGVDGTVHGSGAHNKSPILAQAVSVSGMGVRHVAHALLMQHSTMRTLAARGLVSSAYGQQGAMVPGQPKQTATTKGRARCGAELHTQ